MPGFPGKLCWLWSGKYSIPADCNGPTPTRSSATFRLPVFIARTGILRLTEAVRHRDPVILTTTDFEAFEPLLHGDRFFVLSIDGDLDRPETVVFSTEQYRKALTDNDWCSKFVSGCLAAKTVLYVGASPKAIENFLSGLRLGPQRSDQSHNHFALVEVEDDFEAHSERFLLKYGINLLGFRASPGYPEVAKFLTKPAPRPSETRWRRGIPSARPGWIE